MKIEGITFDEETQRTLDTIDEVKTYLYKHKVPCRVDAWRDFIVTEIVKGHWKDDHMRCDNLMANLGYRFITFSFWESKGEDFYSARRYYLKEV